MNTQAGDTGKPQAKTLKFVTNYGQPQVKRRRIGAACLTCRKRKTACSGERPTCETCSQNRLECAGYSSETPAAPGHKRTTSDNGSREVKSTQSASGSSWQRDQIKLEAGIDPSLQATMSRSNVPAAALPYSQRSTEHIQEPHQPAAQDSTSDNARAGASLFSGPRNRMPYFRWLGPTAIMPGFKQMVVKVKRQDTDMTRSSNGDGMAGSPAMHEGSTGPSGNQSNARMPSAFSGTPSGAVEDVRTPLNLPFYDTSPMPPSELITHLAQTFFTHLGCNYPFLQRERFLRDLEEKQVDAILVDAVCALAARFSTHSLLTQQSSDDNKKPTPAEYGHVFAQRAKAALVDTYACPTVAAVQAALLLAYLEFGESRDSGLWMYLGISIRMAQDLGMHKLEGLRYKGKSGPTPKMIKRESVTSPELPSKLVGEKIAKENKKDGMKPEPSNATSETDETGDETSGEVEEQKSVEQERVDTFWAVFLLDRVVSSGTGRRCMLRDKDIEISFPALDSQDAKTGWPAPFPALIRIVHLYGRVADLLNSIKEPSDITTDTPKRLASMESQVTNLYQGLSSRLHFDAVNFQHYMKAGEGTNFVLLHFWFHLLIVLLHQPTLLKTFEGRMLQLFPNSQQLSMSSAKTIADILSYSQLMDAKASLGNPFTSQPIYIAACAFLKETAEQSATSTHQSRASSPNSANKKKDDSRPNSSTTGTPLAVKRMSISELSNSNHSSNSASDRSNAAAGSGSKNSSSEQHSTSAPKHVSAMAKHTLLATAATQHYQLCYKALQSLETYWSGAKYILTVLDQKFEGVRDPLLYTVEEGESAMEQPRPEPAFTSPGWRRKASWGQYLPGNEGGFQSDLWGGKSWGQVMGEGGNGDPSKAIGWTLTGTMNSPSTNLAWHYPSGPGTAQTSQQQRRPAQQSRPAFNPITNQYDPPPPQNRFPPIRNNSNGSASGVTSFPAQQQRQSNANTAASIPTPSDADLLLNLHSPYTSNTNHTASSPAFSFDPSLNDAANWNYANLWNPLDFSQGQYLGGDMMIESQDVDMSVLGLDMMPWFDGFGGGGEVGGSGGQDVLFGGGSGVADADGRQTAGGAVGEGTPQG